MSNTEVMLGYAWLIATIRADSTLMSLAPGDVWRALAPQHTQAPYFIVAFAAGSDWNAFRAVRGYSSLLYQAKIVGPAIVTSTLEQGAARLDEVITTPDPVPVTGGIIKSCVREQPLEMNEMEGGKHWTNLGGMYRLFVKATS